MIKSSFMVAMGIFVVWCGLSEQSTEKNDSVVLEIILRILFLWGGIEILKRGLY